MDRDVTVGPVGRNWLRQWFQTWKLSFTFFICFPYQFVAHGPVVLSYSAHFPQHQVTGILLHVGDVATRKAGVPLHCDEWVKMSPLTWQEGKYCGVVTGVKCMGTLDPISSAYTYICRFVFINNMPNGGGGAEIYRTYEKHEPIFFWKSADCGLWGV